MILLTAPPRTGKSTAIKKIVNMLGPGNCGGFYTEEIRQNDERVGFKIISLNGEEGILAHISFDSDYKISRYGVDLAVFEKICLKELSRAISSEKIKYIIIDEIGPMQLFSDEYKKILLQMLSINKPIIGTVFFTSHEWLDGFKKNKEVNMIEINEKNRNQVPIDIVTTILNDNVEYQRKMQKAQKYVSESERFTFDDNKTIIHSEHGVRTVTYTNKCYYCDCEFFKINGTCSHIIATVMYNEKIENKQV